MKILHVHEPQKLAISLVEAAAELSTQDGYQDLTPDLLILARALLVDTPNIPVTVKTLEDETTPNTIMDHSRD